MAWAACPAQGHLATVLGEIWAAVGVPAKETRWLGGAAVSRSLAWRLQAPAAPVPCIELETLLDGIRRGVGLLVRPGIPEAKRILRLRGSAGEALARRLGRVSKGRNAAAHLDVILLQDLLL